MRVYRIELCMLQVQCNAQRAELWGPIDFPRVSVHVMTDVVPDGVW